MWVSDVCEAGQIDEAQVPVKCRSESWALSARILEEIVEGMIFDPGHPNPAGSQPHHRSWQCYNPNIIDVEVQVLSDEAEAYADVHRVRRGARIRLVFGGRLDKNRIQFSQYWFKEEPHASPLHYA